jgi:hypothetical protein
MTSGLAFIYPSLIPMPNILKTLPTKKTWSTNIPEWRNTTGFFNQWAQTSYQGELIPLPRKANLLTFHPFIQYGQVNNKLLVLNLSDDPLIRSGLIYFFNSKTRKLIGTDMVYTNSVTTIDLDVMNFQPNDLPVFYSPEIAGIPFGLGVSKDKKC